VRRWSWPVARPAPDAAFKVAMLDLELRDSARSHRIVKAASPRCRNKIRPIGEVASRSHSAAPARGLSAIMRDISKGTMMYLFASCKMGAAHERHVSALEPACRPCYQIAEELRRPAQTRKPHGKTQKENEGQG